jgi:hypothetical protein
MKYWKPFVHPYTFCKQYMPSISSQMELNSTVSIDLLFYLTFYVAIEPLSLWVIKSVMRLDTPTLPSIGD